MNEDLFELVGGRATIQAATELFYRKLLEDENLRHFFKRVDMAHLRSRQIMFISMLLVDGSIPAKIFMTPTAGPETTVSTMRTLTCS